MNICCLSQLGLLRQIPWTEWFKKQTLISYSSGGWKSEVRRPAWLGSSWGPFPWFVDDPFLLFPHMVEREKERDREICSLHLHIRALIPSGALSSLCHLNLITSHLTPTSNTITLKIRALWILEGHKDFVYIICVQAFVWTYVSLLNMYLLGSEICGSCSKL